MRFGNLPVTSSTAVLAVSAPSVEKKKRASKFQWFGANGSGAKFGTTAIPIE
jgi:hypothetical protein